MKPFVVSCFRGCFILAVVTVTACLAASVDLFDSMIDRAVAIQMFHFITVN